MLSFLKENPSVPVATTSQVEKSESSQNSISQPEDYLTVSGNERKLRQSTLMLTAMFVVGIGSVWFMVKKTSPSAVCAATDEQAKIEAALAQLSGMQSEVNSQINTVGNRFYQQNMLGQISVDELKKNPFKRDTVVGVEDNIDLQQKRRQLETAAAALQLWSITETPKGLCCMINDKVFYVGDEVNGLRIHQIKTNAVVFEKEGLMTELKIE